MPPIPCFVQRHCIGIVLALKYFLGNCFLKSRDLENIGLNDIFCCTISMKKGKYLEFSTKLCVFSCNIMMKNIAHSISSIICKLTLVFGVSFLIALKIMVISSVNLIEVICCNLLA